jgi:hypothetical protein
LESNTVQETPRVVASRECSWFTVALREDGILAYDPIPGLVITQNVALEVIAIGSQISDGPKPTLVLMQDMGRVDREARAVLTSDQYLGVCSQTALVVGSPVSRTIAGFFVRLNHPPYPVKLFQNPDLAADWLRGFIARAPHGASG